mmetsp:Transcript_4170/g.3527  ORF Transcript_4170/g.3527 Transcript_4170/m.3527 type:complete len:109 (-) Transcript_4170:30-356(-)
MFKNPVNKVNEYLRLTFMKSLPMKVHKDAQVYFEQTGQKHPVIVYSHGMTAHFKTSTFFLREFVRLGYIVVTIDHNDDVVGGEFHDFELRHRDLLRRVDQVSTILHWL